VDGKNKRIRGGKQVIFPAADFCQATFSEEIYCMSMQYFEYGDWQHEMII